MFILYLSDGEIELDGKMSLLEKKMKLEEIIREHPTDFEYFIPSKAPTKQEQMAMERIEARLNLLGTWLLQGEKQSKDYPVLTSYKEKRNRSTQQSLDTLLGQSEERNG